MKNLEKREVRSHNKVRALFAENKVRFARAEQLWLIQGLYRSWKSMESPGISCRNFPDFL